MQSLIDYAPFWLAYFAFAMLGIWCWQKLFFMLPKKGDWRTLITIVGAVLLFTPAPTTAESQHLAPAVFVLLLDVLSGINPAQSQAILWLLGTACLAVFVVLLSKLFGQKNKKSS